MEQKDAANNEAQGAHHKGNPFLTDIDADIMSDVYRYQLWHLSARIDDLKIKHPGYAYRDELKQASKALALAIHDTRFYYDQQHFDEWEKLIAETRQLLKKVMFQLKYRSHFAEVICYTSIEDGGFLYYGEVIGTDDLITFGGKTLEEAEQDFHDAIDEFLDEKNVNSGY